MVGREGIFFEEEVLMLEYNKTYPYLWSLFYPSACRLYHGHGRKKRDEFNGIY